MNFVNLNFVNLTTKEFCVEEQKTHFLLAAIMQFSFQLMYVPGELEDCVETGGIYGYFLFEEESIVDEYALNAKQVHDICRMLVFAVSLHRSATESCKRT